MSGRSSTGSAVKSRSILDYFKRKSDTPQAKPGKSKGTIPAPNTVVDVSSGEDDNDDVVQVLSEIKTSSSGDCSGAKVIRKCAVSRTSFSSVSKSSDNPITSPVIGRTSTTQSRDSGSFAADDDETIMDSSDCAADDGMELDMSEFVDVLLDEVAGSERENELRQVIADSSTGASDETAGSSENDYQLTNFRNMIDFVLNDASHTHLLNSRDWEIIENVTSLSVSAQRLFIRLYLRKHNWIRSSHINYPEVADPDRLPQLLRDLVQSKLLIHCEFVLKNSWKRRKRKNSC